MNISMIVGVAVVFVSGIAFMCGGRKWAAAALLPLAIAAIGITSFAYGREGVGAAASGAVVGLPVLIAGAVWHRRTSHQV